MSGVFPELSALNLCPREQMLSKDPQGLYVQSPKLNQLNILREVASDAHITQAELARRCSLSVAMVNNYMKDLCKSDFLQYNRKSPKSVSYHLTPAGIHLLDQLQNHLIGEMAQMFSGAKKHVKNRILDQSDSTLHRVVVYGTGDLAQIVIHSLEKSDIRIVGICDDTPQITGRDFCGYKVVEPAEIRLLAPDAFIVAAAVESEAIQEQIDLLTQRGVELIHFEDSLEHADTEAPLRDPATAFYRSSHDERPSFKKSATNIS
jgi:predicted transcriptional regulator